MKLKLYLLLLIFIFPLSAFGQISFQKQPHEKFAKGFIAQELPSGVTITGVTVAAIEAKSGASANSVIQSTTGTIQADGAHFYVVVQNGTNGVDYKITFTYTASDGEIREEELLMQVREI